MKQWINASRTAGVILLCAIALSACKPTEKNYKAAYDAAIAKRTAATKTADDLTDGHEIQREGAPRKVIQNGDTLLVLTARLSGYGDDASAPVKRYNLAVGAYKMPANAVAQTAALKEDGWDARVLQTHDGVFYVIAAQSDDRDEIAAKLKTFRKRYPEMHFVGMPDGPVAIEAARR